MGFIRDAMDRVNLGKRLEGVVLKVNTKLGGDNVRIPGDITTWVPALKR